MTRERYRCLSGDCNWMSICKLESENMAEYLDFCPDCWFVRVTLGGRVRHYGNADSMPYAMRPELRERVDAMRRYTPHVRGLSK